MEEETPVEEGLLTPAAPSLASGVELDPEFGVWLGGTGSSVGEVRSCRSFLCDLLSEMRRLDSPPARAISLLA